MVEIDDISINEFKFEETMNIILGKKWDWIFSITKFDYIAHDTKLMNEVPLLKTQRHRQSSWSNPLATSIPWLTDNAY